MHNDSSRRSVAIVGSGVSGLTAAYVLRNDWDVTVFESDDRVGGHAHTHTVADPGATHRVDTGFIVHNDRTYPMLRRLFRELDVDVHPTEMSMSIHCDGCGLEYAGGRGGKGVFAQRRRLLDPRYIAMLLGVKRFGRLAHALLDSPESPTDPVTYGDFLRAHGFSDYFISHYAIPVVSCVWSSGHETALEYPARYLFEFLKHHGFLSIKGSPQWYTVVGGSGTYVDKVRAAIDASEGNASSVQTSNAIRSISRAPDGVELTDAHGTVHRADAVVIATHANDALAMLADPSDDERRILGAFEYSDNEVQLHRDPSLLPEAAAARSAWNYRMDGCADRSDHSAVTYWMNRLQGIESERPFLVTLNAAEQVDPASVIATMAYTHPIYTPASVAAQGELKRLFSDRTVFAGAYHGWGFHEDGCRSGVAAAEALGTAW
ncbi:NAD(P)/FAD-dependent oxidoreductase [Aeromicrobium fastidiosum]|uniref:FAD-dependent oxidoreductase n=1 Tax=Aeromicrobium fastidiosum TaxID=52699 RepID=A0A641AQB5_9ACTN|nr:FAD-dependent oxidoreductase [Aeromicrobium fastidiosum]KAA1378587.1 FAD-dependent oxidoreductase [Aeromicrobium fastidiosum]MBP2392438.1 putative NAD/FAD-binding protein [Aeromicrobium fastidiosum]